MSIKKIHTVFEPVSIPLEDKIEVPFTVVGSQQWFDTAFEPDAVFEDEMVVISDPAQLESIVVQAGSLKIIGVDTETTGDYKVGDKGYTLNPHNPTTRIVLLQIGNEDHVWVISPEYIDAFKDVLENPCQLHLAHNWEYDFKWLLVKNQIHPVRLYCSMLAEQLLKAGKVGYKVGLADCARRYEPYNIVSKAVRSQFTRLGDGKMTRQMVEYAVRDIPLLFPVYRAQRQELIDSELGKIADMEFRNIKVAVEMETGGYHIDERKLDLLISYWEGQQKLLEEEILNEYDRRRKELGQQTQSFFPEMKEVFDLKSNKEKLEAMHNLGIAIGDVQRSTLESKNDPFTDKLARYSGILKMTSTYGDNIKRKISRKPDPEDDVVYPRFAQLGAGSGGGEGRDTKDTTATGRWVGDAQQFPRKSDGRYAPLSKEHTLFVQANLGDLIARFDAEYAQQQKEKAA